MERSDFTQLVKNEKILNNATVSEITELATQYPYASLVQLLAYNVSNGLEQGSSNKLRLFFENPIHFNKLTKPKLPIVQSLLDEREKLKQELAILLEQESKAETTINKLDATQESKHKIEDEIADNEADLPYDKSLIEEKSTDLKEPGETINAEKISQEELVGDKNSKVAKTSVAILSDDQEEITNNEHDEVVIVNNEMNEIETNKVTDVDLTEVSNKKESDDEDVLKLINELPEASPIIKEIVTVKQASENLENQNASNEEPNHLMIMMSFTDWLQFYKAKNDNEEADRKGRDAIRSAWQKEKLAEAMDDEEDVVPDEIFEKAMKSVSFGDQLVTEPLADLYVKQGKKDQAIALYKKLSLLNPEKKTYFATKIKNLHL